MKSDLESLRPPRLLLNLMLVGVIARFANLTAWSLWLDEAATWMAVTKASWAETVTAEVNHPPLWRLITRAFTDAFGDRELILRAPAALLSAAAIWMVWCVALRLLDPRRMPSRGGFDRSADRETGRRIAAWTTGLVALLAHFVEYGQEARMYPLLLVLGLGQTLLYLRWLDRPSRAVLIGYAVLGVLALYTHYFGLLPMLGHAVHALWLARKTKGTEGAVRPAGLLVAIVIPGLLFVPWFIYLLQNYSGIAKARPEPFSMLAYIAWRIGVGPALLAANPVHDQMGPLQVAQEHLGIALASVIFWLVPLGLGAFAMRKRPGLRPFLLTTLIVPAAFVLLIYPKFALLHERYAHFLAPYFVLLAVLGAFSLRGIARKVMLGGLACLTALSLFAYHMASPELQMEGRAGVIAGRVLPERFVPDPEAIVTKLSHGHPYGREPWRRVHDFVRQLSERGDLVAIHAWYMDYCWQFQEKHDPENRPPADLLLLPQYEWGPETVIEKLGSELEGRKRVFLILAHEETPNPDHWIRALYKDLAVRWSREGAQGFKQVGPVQFPHGIRVVIFEQK